MQLCGADIKIRLGSSVAVEGIFKRRGNMPVVI
jgi:hypothetical protein